MKNSLYPPSSLNLCFTKLHATKAPFTLLDLIRAYSVCLFSNSLTHEFNIKYFLLINNWKELNCYSVVCNEYGGDENSFCIKHFLLFN